MNQPDGARLETRGHQPMMLLGAKLTGDLRGLLFEASVKQHFCNPTDKHVEVVYTFPLPWGAVLLGVEVLLGDQRLHGAVVEKRQAAARYEEALSEGNAAIMMEQNADHSYSLNLGNLAAKEHCVITLRYAQTLQFEHRGLRLLIPTVIAPRYGDAVRDGGLLPHQVPSHNLAVEHPFDLELRLHEDLARARVASPSHPIGVAHNQTEEGSVLTVSLARQAALDRDFVLLLEQLARDAMAVLGKDAVEPEGVSVLASFCPHIPNQGPATTAVKVLVDCSGSMAGDSMDAAKRALQACALQLGSGDRFSLSRFGTTVEHRSRGLWKATQTTKLAAQRWVGSLSADLGGTNMEAALESTFALPQAVTSDVLIVTDGEIAAIDATITSAQASGHRVFVVGIGASPAETHLRRLAEATGGACEFIAPGEAVEAAVLRMFARLRSPRLTDITVVWPPEVEPLWVAPLNASVFDGDTVNVFALLGHAPEAGLGEVCLMGRRSPEVKPEVFGRVSFSGPVETADTVSRVGAAVRVRTAMTKRTEVNQLDGQSAEATRLATAYQLITDTTNFLLVHERPQAEDAADMPELHRVVQMVPAGWGGTSTVKFGGIAVLDLADDSMPLLACASISLQSPSVFRTSRNASMKFCAMDAFDLNDVPAFLRRGDPVIDHANPKYWAESAHDAGLTPLGLSEWLHLTAAFDWPKSYSELRRIGLGAWVVEWLELAMAARDREVLAEETVVATFLAVMAHRDMRESLVQSLGVVQRSGVTTQRLAGLFTGKPSSASPVVDVLLAEAMMTALEGVVADAWPQSVYTLGSEM